MYAIRVDSERQALLINVSGRITTSEAQRAVTQAFALAEAVKLQAVCCDVTELEQGPGGSLTVAALIALSYQEPMRIAFIGTAYHARALRRLILFSGIRGGIKVFGTTMAAEGWLLPVMAAAEQRLSLTENLHLRQSMQPASKRARTVEKTRQHTSPAA
jgi:hypothetical protein